MAELTLPITASCFYCALLGSEDVILTDDILELIKDSGLNIKVLYHQLDPKGKYKPTARYIEPDKFTGKMALSSFSEYFVFDNEDDLLLFKLYME